MKRLIAGILAAVMLLTGSPALAGISYSGGSAVKIELIEWEYRGAEGYTSTGLPMNSYAKGGPTVDDNGNCILPLKIMGVTWNYSISDKNNEVTLSHENRTIVVPYEGDTAAVDGVTVSFPHTCIVPPDGRWDSEPYTEIYFNYSYLPAIFGVEKAEWDKNDLTLLITENAETPVSDKERAFRQQELEEWNSTESDYGPEEIIIEPLPPTDSRSAYVDTPSQFSDIADSSSLLNTCVNELVDRGVVSGYEDGTFGPDLPVTRAEAAAMICRLMGFELNNKETFPDVQYDEWYAGYVGAIAELGIVNGYDDGTFRPKDNITYYEIFRIVYTIIGRTPVTSEIIASAIANGLTDGLSSFADNTPTTRGDMCIILSEMLDSYINTWETKDGDYYYGSSEMTLADYLSGKPTFYHYFCSEKLMYEYGAMVKKEG